MAPTASSKRSRLPFSPPRPEVSKVTKSTKEKSKNNKGATKRKSGGIINGNSGVSKSTPKPKPRVTSGAKEKGKRKRIERGKQRGAGGTMRALLNAASDEDDDDDELESHDEKEDDNDEVNDIVPNMDTDVGTDKDTDSNPGTEESGSERHDLDDDEDDDREDGREDADEPASPASRLNFSSPEPDFILAEVTHPHNQSTKPSSSPDSDEYPIPLPLIHRIMHTHFSVPNTVLSQHARALMGTYVGVFVKEAIRRCVDEKKERVKRGEGGDVGWLEVEDLERVGCQLVLDF
ncbi:hypothetical protein PV04_02374 [Phialophora macrospora]|uniref:Uncharacterized protein n=1 Tax=Phialophora macrospora TaxID=1851006 RepID=A0A0D2GD97_9EURO|nr:hypothetical protein PV04_02374 [Phialophora macrospora]